MNRTWKIYYMGNLMKRCLTRRGAESEAFQMCKDKDLNFKLIEVKEDE